MIASQACLLCLTCNLLVSVPSVSARDSGKVMVDAILGEIVTTCEKIHWLIKEGEKWLKPERRSAGVMVGDAPGTALLWLATWFLL